MLLRHPVVTEMKNQNHIGSNLGFSLIELMIAIVVGLIITAAAIPQIKEGVYQYRLRGAVASATWAIQSTRFQALMEGYPYQVVFSHTNNTYQIQDLPSGTTYANVGSTVPLSGSAISLDQDMTIQFKPNGSVTTTVGTPPLSISYQGSTKQMTITSYGNVSVN